MGGVLLGDLRGELVLVLLGVLTVLLYRLYRGYDYFQQRGFPCARTNFLLGSNFDFFRRKLNLGETNEMIYRQLKGNRCGGFFQFTQPIFMLLDPGLIQAVTIKDFSHFQDHGLFDIDAKTNPMDMNLFTLRGSEWRALRQKLAPTFTSGKLKWMFGLIEECGDLFSQQMEQLPQGEDIQIKDIFARFTTDIIASCAFGIDANALKDPDCQFRVMAKTLFNPPDPKRRLFKGMIRLLFPRVFRLFKMKSLTPEISDFFISITKQGFEHRLRTGEKRPDFLQLMLELREKGRVQVDQGRARGGPEDQETLEISDELLAAQAFIFFLAGFENAATMMSLTAYFLSKDRELQGRVQREVEAAERKHGGLSYDAIKNMRLLDACVSESLRLMPPADAIFRRCNKEYSLGDGQTIEEGSLLVIPVFSLHRDADYFDEPLSFRPERFLQTEPLPGTFLPFGDGPRVCIAQRFAMLEIKVGLCRLLKHFDVTPSDRNIEPLRFTPGKLAQVQGDLWMKIHKRNNINSSFYFPNSN